jgi:ectoine hydroxylase
MLMPTDIATYERDGVLVLNELFTPEEVDALRLAFERDALIPGDHRIVERDGTSVRAVYASHHRQPEYSLLTRLPRLLRPARQLLGPDLYVYQHKINAKPPFSGDGWAWHQDYVAWRIVDNLPAPYLINVAIFLDDVTEFNGPILFVPGSHNDGLVRSDRDSEARSSQHLDPDDIALSPEEMSGLVERHGMISPKGRRGTVVFFHPEIVHGSAANLSPYPRRLVIITYNQTRNPPRPLGEPRPEYLVSRDTRPLEVEEGMLTAAPAAGLTKEMS